MYDIEIPEGDFYSEHIIAEEQLFLKLLLIL